MQRRFVDNRASRNNCFRQGGAARRSQVLNQRGAVMSEVAISVVAFFVLVGMGIEMMRLSFLNVSTQLVANTGARLVSVGAQCGGTPTAPVPCQNAALANVVEAQMIMFGRSIATTLDNTNICIRPVAAAAACNNFPFPPLDPNATPPVDANDAGGPKNLVVVVVRRPTRYFFGLGTQVIEARAMARNEPFNVQLMP